MSSNTHERDRIASLLGLPPGALEEPSPAALNAAAAQITAPHLSEQGPARMEWLLGLKPGSLQATAAPLATASVVATAEAQLRALRQPAGHRIAVLHAVYGPAMDRLANGH